MNAHLIIGLIAILLFAAAAAFNDSRIGWLGAAMLTLALTVPGA